MFFYEVENSGYLQVSGEDRLAFLQRQTTNDLRLLRPGHALISVLTSPAARILDVFYLLPEPEAIGVVTLPGYAQMTARFLKSRIFFMDKVALANASSEFCQVDVFGAEAEKGLERLGIARLPGVDQVFDVQLPSLELRLLRLQPGAGLGYRFMVHSSHRQALLDLLQSTDFQQVDQQVYRLAHVESGIPFGGAELVESYTPLEAGLEAAVSSDKGCYTGQEVIARQVTYDKVTQRLSGLQSQSLVQPGARLWAGDKAAGVVTSSAQSPRFGSIALAMVKKPHDLPGTLLEAQEADGARIPVRTVALPFVPG